MTKLEQFLAEEEPVDESVTLKFAQPITLYKLDSKGKERQWTITVVTDGHTGDIIIDTGLVEGKKVEQVISIDKGKNVGKANATTPATQALAEAQAKLEQQLRSGYVKDLADVKASGTLGSGLPQCMLAQKFDPKGLQKGSKTLEQMKIKGKKIHVQPKLDGNRCLIKLAYTDESGLTATMYTRKGDVMPVQLSHILDDALQLGSDVKSELILDGELFSTELSFNELNGHLKRKDSQDPKQLAKIKYHIYDVMYNAPYNDRYTIINRFASPNIEVIPSFEIVATDENIKEKLEEFLSQNHEGLMIRTLDSGYEHKRAWQLCKVKLFEDQEFKILDLEPDAMGRLGHFVMEMDEVGIDRDGKEVRTFKAGCTGIDHAEGKKMLANKDKYIGKMATIEYFGKDIRPRFPKYKGIRQD